MKKKEKEKSPEKESLTPEEVKTANEEAKAQRAMTRLLGSRMKQPGKTTKSKAS